MAAPEQFWVLCDPLAAGSDSGCVPAGHRLSLQDYSGTAGQQSGLALQGTQFSTRDADNDNCLCKCAQMLSGGEWSRGHPHAAPVGASLRCHLPALVPSHRMVV